MCDLVTYGPAEQYVVTPTMPTTVCREFRTVLLLGSIRPGVGKQSLLLLMARMYQIAIAGWSAQVRRHRCFKCRER